MGRAYFLAKIPISEVSKKGLTLQDAKLLSGTNKLGGVRDMGEVKYILFFVFNIFVLFLLLYIFFIVNCFF